MESTNCQLFQSTIKATTHKVAGFSFKGVKKCSNDWFLR